MTQGVDIHPANEAERLAAYRQVHEVWGGDKPLEEFVSARLRSIQHNRARWWVLTVDGEVCASLGSYPLRFMAHGRAVQGFGFGAVYTPPAQRKRGYAEQLCRHVAQVEQSGGAEVGLLFSDISPDYYAKMGWELVDQTTYKAELEDLWEPTRSLGVRVKRPEALISTLSGMWDAEQRQHDLWLARDAGYWRYLLSRNPEDHHVMLCDRGGIERGYARLAFTGQEGWVEEVCLRQGVEDPWREDAWVVVAHYAASQGAARLATWQQPPPRSRKHWVPTQRAAAITMVLRSGACAAAPLTSSHIHSTDHF
jgi:predicted acetyltransferase